MNFLRLLRQGLVWALLCAGTVLVVVTFTPVVSWIARQLSYEWTDSNGDILIVLAADSMSPDSILAQGGEEALLGQSSYWRSVYAAQAWKQGHFSSLVISGAEAGPEMKRFLMFDGVPEQAIRLEDRSRSTRENALFTQEMLAQTAGDKVLLTSDFHMYRAAAAFRKAGLQITPRPFPDVLKRSNARQARWECFWIEGGEVVKILYYRLRGWI